MMAVVKSVITSVTQQIFLGLLPKQHEGMHAIGHLNTDSRVQVQRAHMREQSPPYMKPQPHNSEQDRQP